MIYTAINSKLINIARVQKEQGTEAMSKKALLQYQRCCSNTLLASFQPPVFAWRPTENFTLSFKTKNSYDLDE